MRSGVSSRVRHPASLGPLLALALVACGGDKPSEPEGPGALATLTIVQSPDTLSELATRQLGVSGADARGRGVLGISASWRSSDTSIAVVTAGGVLTARQPGNAVISATSGSVTATLALRVLPVPVRDVTVRLVGAVSDDTLLVGATAGMIAEARDVIGTPLVGRKVTITVSDTTRGTVDASGRVTGRSVGALDLVLTTDTVVRRRTIIVRPTFAAALALRLADPRQLRDTLWIGLRDSAIVTFSDSSGKALLPTPFRPVTYSSSDTRIATVDFEGRVFPQAAGSATIRASGDGLVAARLVAVVPAPLATVLSGSDTIRLAPGDSAQIRPVLVDAAGLSVRSTANPTITYAALDARTSVSATGWVRGLATGLSQVRIVADGRTGTVPVRIATRDPARAFKVEVRFVGPPPTAAVADAFAAARAKWESVIRETIGTLTDTLPKGLCGSTDETHVETIQDVVIFARIDTIDGPGQILGSAGPCAGARAPSGKFIPHIGRMVFDSADMTTMVTRGILQAVIMHEMGHVLGVGTLWSAPNTGGITLARQTGSDPRFFGSGASFASAGMGLTFFSLGLTGTSALESVPLENTGGSGTAGSHWRETVYDNELMTGFINNGANPLSLLTVQAMADMGYAVATSAAEPLGKFFQTPAIRASDVFGAGASLRIAEVLTGPEWISNGRGRMTRLPGAPQTRQ